MITVLEKNLTTALSVPAVGFLLFLSAASLPRRIDPAYTTEGRVAAPRLLFSEETCDRINTLRVTCIMGRRSTLGGSAHEDLEFDGARRRSAAPHP